MRCQQNNSIKYGDTAAALQSKQFMYAKVSAASFSSYVTDDADHVGSSLSLVAGAVDALSRRCSLRVWLVSHVTPDPARLNSADGLKENKANTARP